MRHNALISIGSNDLSFWGSPQEMLEYVLAQIARVAAGPVTASRLFKTPAFPKGIGPDFVNAAARFETALGPSEVLKTLHEIEAEAGRKRVVRWGQRTLDLDLLALGDAVLPDQETYQTWRDLPLAAQMQQAPDALILPHPRLTERAFVLVPLSEIAPDWRHPVDGKTIAALCAALPAEDRAEVVPITSP